MPFIQDSPSPSPVSSATSLSDHDQFPTKTLSSRPHTQIDERTRRRQDHHEADIVIVGAGILGCAAAVTLARQGRSVILLERSLKEPDRIVGELLQPGGVQALEKLGLRDCLEGIDAIRVDGYGIWYYDKTVHIPYPDNTVDGDSKPEGRSFHHGRFIAKLRAAAIAESNISVIESTAKGIVKDDYSGHVLGVEAVTQGEQDYYFGSQTLICDGYASKFRDQAAIRHKPLVRSKFYGLELHDCPLPMPNHGHVILSDAAPTLLYQISTHDTRALIDVPENTPTAHPSQGGVKAHLTNVVIPTLPEAVRPTFREAVEKGQIRSMPNSYLPPSTNRTPGLLLLGDAMNMRHPLTGGGMTVALNDVLLLSQLLSPEVVPQLSDTKRVLSAMRTLHWQRKTAGCAAVVNILAMALYSLFAANTGPLRTLQRGCFAYFLLGGNCIAGPCGLLAGIIRQPLVLVYHFFAVAFYSIFVGVQDSWKAGRPWMIPYELTIGAFLVILEAVKVIGPFLLAEMKS